MNVEGPDILKVTCIDVPPEIKMKLQSNALTKLKTSPLPKQMKFSNTTAELFTVGKQVPAVYIYRTVERNDAEENIGYKLTQQYFVDDQDDLSVKPVMYVPIGVKYSDSQSNR